MDHVDQVGAVDPLAICKECRGTGYGNSRGRAECWRCYGAGLEGGAWARGWLRRRMNGLAELFMLSQPELDDEAPRAGCDVICTACGEAYLRHAVDPRARFLNVLCDGRRVKL